MKVFISHSHTKSDENWADLLRERLQQQGIDVWNPEAEITPGENWGLKHGKGLEACDAMVILLSPESVKSTWVQHEMEYALTSPRFRDRVVPVVIRPTAQIPWILNKRNVITAKGDGEQMVREVAAVLKETTAGARG